LERTPGRLSDLVQLGEPLFDLANSATQLADYASDDRPSPPGPPAAVNHHTLAGTKLSHDQTNNALDGTLLLLWIRGPSRAIAILVLEALYEEGADETRTVAWRVMTKAYDIPDPFVGDLLPRRVVLWTCHAG